MSIRQGLGKFLHYIRWGGGIFCTTQDQCWHYNLWNFRTQIGIAQGGTSSGIACY